MFFGESVQQFESDGRTNILIVQKVVKNQFVTFGVLVSGLQSPGKPRTLANTVTKSNTVTAKPLVSGGSVGRRSTISYEAKTASNEKTNMVSDFPGLVHVLYSPTVPFLQIFNKLTSLKI